MIWAWNCLEPQLLLCEGAHVMLTCNMWTEAGLCNGAMGTVKHIIYNDNDKPPVLPLAVVIKFDDNYIGPSISSTTPNYLPIVPVSNTSNSLSSAYERQQLPLRLSWSITIHRSQGLTLRTAWVDLGPSEKLLTWHMLYYHE